MVSVAETAGAAGRFDDDARSYDAVLVLSFGGPDGPDDVIPFLEKVTTGRGVPRERLLEVAEHYQHFGGASPINGQNLALIAALKTELAAHQVALPIYFGNRNWHPFVEDTVQQMSNHGVRRALVFVTSAYSSYSGCRQYREDLARAESLLNGPAITFDKIRVFYNHPGFVGAMAELVQAALAPLPAPRRERAEVIFTAHSIPMSMARTSAYEPQLREACHLVAEQVGIDGERYRLAYQSRSGSPQVPWLEPDILDVMTELTAAGASDLVIVPIGFLSDHMEILFDLDEEARERAESLGVTMLRVPTVGTHPQFVAMIRELIVERMTADPLRLAFGTRGPNHDLCPANCCPRGEGRPAAARPAAVAAHA